MTPKTLGQLALVALLAAASVTMFMRSSERRKINLSPYQTLGTIAGAEVSKLLNHTGDIVLVLPDPGSTRDPVMDAEVTAFKAGLASAGRAAVRATATVTMDPFLSMRTGGAMPPERFLELLKKHPQATAFVLFLGFPLLDEAALATVKAHPAKQVVISAALPGYEELIAQGVLHLAIVPRPQSADQTPAPAGSLRESFDQEYIILGRDRGAGLTSP